MNHNYNKLLSASLAIFLCLSISRLTVAQNVGINADNSSPHASAMLDIKSTSKGLLIPRMTTSQRTSILSPATGLLVYDLNLQSFYLFNGSTWVPTSTDNLGNHSATTNLNLNDYHITNVDYISTRGLGSYDKLRVWSNSQHTIGMHNSMTYGYLNDYAMTFTMSAVADRGWIWRDFNHTKAQGAMSLTTDGRLYVGNNSTINGTLTLGDYTLPSTDGTVGQVLKTDGSGAVSWGAVAGDNLGSHVATTNLNLNNNLLTNVTTLSCRNQDSYDKLRVWNASVFTIGMNSAMTYGYLDGYAMTFTMNNQANRGWIWRSASHAKSQGAMSLTTDGRLYVGNNSTVNGTLTVGAYTLPNTDGSVGQVLTTNGAGMVSWTAGTTDNLGNHTATTNLQMNGKWISASGDDEGIFVNSDGKVGINDNTPEGALEVVSKIIAGAIVIDQDHELTGGNIVTTNTSAFQTFVAGVTGVLAQLRLYFQTASSAITRTVSIYEGIGTGGNLIGSFTLTSPGDFALSFGATVLTKGETYTIYISNAINWEYQLGNPYPSGFASINSNADFGFVTYMRRATNFLVGAQGVGINNASPGVALDVDGDIEYTGSITDVSDRRLKENFLPIENALGRLKQLKGFTYNMKNDPQKVREYGVIAQDVQKVFPEMVKVIDREKGYLGVSYIQLVPVLLEAVKAQEAKITQMEKENKALKAKLQEMESLKTRLAKIEAILEVKAKK
ncbi:MAG TPA: hypothetical protein DCS93_19585 [Microscillaceae bacterium]|nr:hypothetical protein [Microscillaceae bacterium]